MINANYKSSFFAFLFAFFIFSFSNLHAQDSTDPLNKPDIWSKIEKNPKDMRLWASYVGKDLNSLTSTDEDNIIKWCSQINKDYKPNILPEDTWMGVAENHHYNTNQKLQMDIEYNVFHKQLKEEILQESPVIQELTSNIETNFIIIEDMMRLEFEELGTNYIDYEAVHPKNDYPKDKWIVEKNKELNELKLLSLKLLKANATSFNGR